MDEKNQLRSSILKDDFTTDRKSTIKTLIDKDFYKQDDWFYKMCDLLFKLERRGATIKNEVYYGVIHFISCLYCLAVVPQQLVSAGYNGKQTVVSVALCTGAGSILCGIFANLPFVLAPPTVVSIFLSVFLQQMDDKPEVGNIAVIFSGLILMLFGWRPLGKLASRLIPLPIQVGTTVGIGLLTALAGSTEIDLVEKGTYTILKIGKITPEVCISFFGVLLICVFMKHHWKGAFCCAVIVCALFWWIYDDSFPNSVAAVPEVDTAKFSGINTKNIPLLTVDLVFLYVLYLNGLMTSLSNLAVLTREDNTIPRGRWIYIICGIFTVIAGFFQSSPILVSPESSASIKEGAKTGLSAVVAGLLFLFSLFFAPIFENVPPAGTSPVLILIGIILFNNALRIDWRDIGKAAPAFIVLFYIPFTYSIIQGVTLGYIVYLVLNLTTGELFYDGSFLLVSYFPGLAPYLERFLNPTFKNSFCTSYNTSHISTTNTVESYGSHEVTSSIHDRPTSFRVSNSSIIEHADLTMSIHDENLIPVHLNQDENANFSM